MSWCDKLASTPTVGLKLNPSFVPAEHMLSAMAPLLSTFLDGDKPTFNIETLEAFSLVFNTDEGYKYSFDSISNTVGFNHRVRAKPSSAGPPVVEFISKPAPYTELLLEVIKRLRHAVDRIPDINQRAVRRVGIVSFTQVEIGDAPPAIQNLIDEISRPFGGHEHMNVSVASSLPSDDKFTHRCIHTIIVPEDESGLITLQLDWQKILKHPSTVPSTNVERLLNQSMDEALKYFETVAEGGLSDVSNNRR